MTRKHRGYMTVDVDLDEALGNCSDEMILQEYEERKLKAVAPPLDVEDELRDAHEELLRGRPAEALAIIERLINPKWSNTRACEAELRKNVQHNQVKVG